MMLLERKAALSTGSVRGTSAGMARVVLNQVHDEGNPQVAVRSWSKYNHHVPWRRDQAISLSPHAHPVVS